MKYSMLLQRLWLPFTMLVLYVVAITCRPLLPVDETRYMTVAWEMFLRQGWLEPLTVNFAPYHHKPPFLFWMINLSWSVFGISRWAGLIPIVLSSLICVYLTGLLGKRLFPNEYNQQKIWLIMAGGLPFLTYGTLVMFDMTICMFVLLSFVVLFKFKDTRDIKYALILGVLMGLGVLTKGPVAYLYILPVSLLAPYWSPDFSRAKQYYWGILLAVLVSALPVLFWLIPVLQASDNNFAFWLVWNQTAGRVTGNFNASHIRPFWFYLPFVPLLFLPWIFFPTFWKNLSNIKQNFKNHEGLRFLALWVVPVFVAFSLISGKQPHYLLPLIPAVALLSAYQLRNVDIKNIFKIFAIILVLFVGGQIVAGQTIFKKYSLEPLVEFLQTYPEHKLAFVSNYQGEIGFTGKLHSAVDDVAREELDQWFVQHPDGWAIVRFRDETFDPVKYKMLFSYRYRGRYLGVLERIKD